MIFIFENMLRMYVKTGMSRECLIVFPEINVVLEALF